MIEENAGDIFMIVIVVSIVLFLSTIFFMVWDERDIKDSI